MNDIRTTDRLVAEWVQVRDARGGRHLEMRWRREGEQPAAAHPVAAAA